MRIRFAVVAVLGVVCCTPAPASADATLFLGKTLSSPNHRSVRGFALGASMLVVGFEFEVANIREDPTLHEPSLKTTSATVFAQTLSISGIQLYVGTGAGYYRERLGADEATGLVFNTGGGAKVKLAGPLRVRVDYRIFNLRGTPQRSKIQRVYGGLNLAF
jgi:hypothetical protein